MLYLKTGHGPEIRESSTVDLENRPSHPSTSLGGEEEGGSSHVIVVTESSERNSLDKRLFFGIREKLSAHLGGDEARGNGVHSHC